MCHLPLYAHQGENTFGGPRCTCDRLLRGNEFRAAYVAGGSSTGSGRRCRGRPLPQINPQQGEALALARSAAFEARQFARARDYWQRLLVLVLVLVLALVLVLVLVLAPADSEMA